LSAIKKSGFLNKCELRGSKPCRFYQYSAPVQELRLNKCLIAKALPPVPDNGHCSRQAATVMIDRLSRTPGNRAFR
jgi:hypothetical protein